LERFRATRGFMSHTNKCLNEVKGNIASDSEAYNGNTHFLAGKFRQENEFLEAKRKELYGEWNLKFYLFFIGF